MFFSKGFFGQCNLLLKIFVSLSFIDNDVDQSEHDEYKRGSTSNNDANHADISHSPIWVTAVNSVCTRVVCESSSVLWIESSDGNILKFWAPP